MVVVKFEVCVLFFVFLYVRLFIIIFFWVNVFGGGSFFVFVFGNFLFVFFKECVSGKKCLLFIYIILFKVEIYLFVDERM